LIAGPSPTSALLVPVRLAATAAGANIRYAYMGQPQMVAAIESGAIEGMVAPFPFSARPVFKGTGVLWIDGVRGDIPAEWAPVSASCMLTTWGFYDNHKQAVRGIQLAMQDVADLIRQKPQEARAALIRGYSDLPEEEVGIAYDKQAQAWTHPFLDEKDMQQELKLVRLSVNAPGLDKIDLARTLLPRP
jgi:ABC-type nitrate/sulfonate/bicarbonate transport system substrate-binding protein